LWVYHIIIWRVLNEYRSHSADDAGVTNTLLAQTMADNAFRNDGDDDKDSE